MSFASATVPKLRVAWGSLSRAPVMTHCLQPGRGVEPLPLATSWPSSLISDATHPPQGAPKPARVAPHHPHLGNGGATPGSQLERLLPSSDLISRHRGHTNGISQSTIPTPHTPLQNIIISHAFPRRVHAAEALRMLTTSTTSTEASAESPGEKKDEGRERNGNQEEKVVEGGVVEGPRYLGGLGPTGAGDKPRVVVLGSGWAACRFLKDLNTKAYDVVSISPRNHMVFTPLLTSTCVGTLEFRSVAEPVEVIQPALSLHPNSHFFLAKCTSINPEKHEITCEVVGDYYADSPTKKNDKWQFSVAYDKLVIAVGAQASTFGISGVHQNAFFLREVHDAQQIRRRLLLNLMKCETPGLSEKEKRRLLTCVVVGGGPTGVEFSGELGDFIRKDVRYRYAHVKDYISVTLIEANEILSSFDISLRGYAERQLRKAGVSLVKGQVKTVGPKSITLDDGTEVPYGLLVWSTGVGPSQFVRHLPLPKSPGGRVAVDDRLAVEGHRDIFALGDCSGYSESTGKTVLPALAQVAERQGRYLAHRFNTFNAQKKWGKKEDVPGVEPGAAEKTTTESTDKATTDPADKPFVYRHLGSMATIGRYRALVDIRESKAAPGISIAGFLSFLIWRSAYLTRVISWRNRFYVMVNWATTMVFGRDISRI